MLLSKRWCSSAAGLLKADFAGNRDAKPTCTRHAPGARVSLVALCFFLSAFGFAQIGGQTAANGPFTLDDVEDRDTTAGGVLRAWVPDNTPGGQMPLQPIDPTSAPLALTLAPGQSSNGAFLFTAKEEFGYINWGFGVPVPSVAGASTLTNPGNITSFTRLRFLACSDSVLTNSMSRIILECYPGVSNVFPKINWNFILPAGKTFTPVALTLRNPTSITDNPSNYTVEQLLGQTRYLAFYFYSGPEANNTRINAYIDDIKLDNNTSAAHQWCLYE